MKSKENNYAFIDSQNLNLGIKGLGWKLDFKKFRVYLKDKHNIQKAFLFIGYINDNNDLYKALQGAFICIFKPTLIHKDGTTKGNCDAELVLHTMIEYPHYKKAVIVSGNGDFHCLIKYLLEKGKLRGLLIPNRLRFSALLKWNAFRPFLYYMNDLQKRLAYKKKGPRKDRTL